MFSKTITSSSGFLMMPPTSRLLYYDLGMNADDDGFCEHFMIMKMTDASPDDLRVLEARGFVKVFDDKVLIIKHWKENNYLRSDRYTPSKYMAIYENEIKAIGIPSVNQVDTQVRLGKVSIGKDIDEDVKLPSKKTNSLALTRGQILSYLKAVPGLTSTELHEQATACNTYMGMSSWQIKDPGIFFRKWLIRYMTEKKVKQAQVEKLAEQDRVMPDLTPEQRERNFRKIDEIRRGVLAKL